jgi:hypothetical protein
MFAARFPCNTRDPHPEERRAATRLERSELLRMRPMFAARFPCNTRDPHPEERRTATRLEGWPHVEMPRTPAPGASGGGASTHKELARIGLKRFHRRRFDILHRIRRRCASPRGTTRPQQAPLLSTQRGGRTRLIANLFALGFTFCCSRNRRGRRERDNHHRRGDNLQSARHCDLRRRSLGRVPIRTHVRFRVQSRHFGLGLSISAFDPKRTSAVYSMWVI